MRYAAIITFLLLSLTACSHNPFVNTGLLGADSVQFASSEATLFGAPQLLNGRLKKTDGEGVFPAVVLLHGCGGIQPKRDHRWVERLTGWGYVTLQVDSFGPRGLTSVCTLGGKESAEMLARRVVDAYDARNYLASQPFVDKKRIAVMGWSNGGSTTLNALYSDRNDPFIASVAMYPYCRKQLNSLNTPLLILIGEKDDWTPAEACRSMMPAGNSRFEVKLKVYPDAYHAYDSLGKPRQAAGSRGSHHLEYNEAAEQDSILMVKEFLEKYLRE